MKSLAIALVLGLVSCGGGSAEPSKSFLNYSTFDRSGSGVLVDSAGNPGSSWSNSVAGDGSTINWGESKETFAWDQAWVYLLGYKNPTNGITYQQVAGEDVYCAGGLCARLPVDGRQHYAPRYPQADYTMSTVGYIVESTTGKRVNFVHWRDVKIAVPCANPYYQNRVCLVQRELWWDDNQTPLGLKLDRTTYYADGLGVGFTIIEQYPTQLRLYLKDLKQP